MRARYFLAVPVAGMAGRRLARLAREAAPATARIVHGDDLHITLCYFGPRRAGPVLRAVSGISPRDMPRAFDARIAGVRPFGATGGRHLVALPDAPSTARLRALYRAIPRSVHSAVPASAAHRPYRPHVTLARRRHGNAWTVVRGRCLLRVDRVALYRSRTDPGPGPRYEIVRSWRLRPRGGPLPVR